MKHRTAKDGARWTSAKWLVRLAIVALLALKVFGLLTWSWWFFVAFYPLAAAVAIGAAVFGYWLHWHIEVNR